MGLRMEMLRQSTAFGSSATCVGGLHRCLFHLFHPGHQCDGLRQRPQLLVHPFGSGSRILPGHHHVPKKCGHRERGPHRLLHAHLRHRLVRRHSPQVHLTQRHEEGNDLFLPTRCDRAAISGAWPISKEITLLHEYINVMEGCVSALFVHATFGHIYL